jgi:predicted nucleic acid-binding protein
MKSITLDLNILLDFLFKREGHEKAAEIFECCANGKARGFVCAHEITTLSYFLNKEIKNRSRVIKTISVILKRFTVIEINEKLLHRALISEIVDFEDAVIEVSSKEKNVDYIVTRNTKDFKKSQIKAITPEEYLVIEEE